MLISQKQLKRVIVETQNGQFLGHVVGFELETDTGVIEKYYVKARIILANLFENDLIINKSQIISFDLDKMIVEDAVVRSQNSKIKKLAEVNNLKQAESIATSESNNQ
jgi:uncharacterized protein YrrD